MTTARLNLRLDEEIKAKAEKASALPGLKSLTEYVVRLMNEDSALIISEYENITVENDVFDRFIEACEKTKAPDKTLLDALEFSKEQGIQ